MTAGQVAQAVQGSGHPERYDQVRAEASKWLDAYGGSGVGGENAEADAAGGGTYYKSYQFAREAKEDSWTAIQRLAGEVGWRAFMVGASLFYVSEEDLYRRKVAYALTPEDDALIGVDFDVDWGKAASELRLTVTVGRWEAAPGTIVSLDGFGPADGRWLVTAWRRDYFQPVAELTLRQPGKEKLERGGRFVGAESRRHDACRFVACCTCRPARGRDRPQAAGVQVGRRPRELQRSRRL
jgi:hypothetical protein